jgi:hypothetical protein
LWNLFFYLYLYFTTKSFTVSFENKNRQNIFFFFQIIFSYLRRKRSKTYYITASKKLNDVDGGLDLPRKSSLNDQDKRIYLKMVERSVRTGRRIQDEKDYNYNIKNDSHSNSFYCLRQFINKHLSSTTANIQRSTEI